MADLTTIADYKDAEGINNPKHDLRLETLVPAVSQLVKTYCGNSIIDFFSTNKEELFNINWDTHIVQLTESPVNALVSVSERPDQGSSYTLLTSGNNDFYLDKATDSVFRTNSTGYSNWKKGPGAVKIVYTAGYATTPSDLKLAVFDLITYYLQDEHKERKVLAGASIQNQATTSMRDNVAFPDHIKRVLDLYKNF
jgi:hypothetical protein